MWLNAVNLAVAILSFSIIPKDFPMTHTLRRGGWFLNAVALISISWIGSAEAATIHYVVSPSPPPLSQATAFVDVTASGVGTAPSPTTASSAFGGSLSHTRLGPNPPPFTASAFGQAEIFTNLNNTAPGTTRNVSVPGFGQFVAQGTGTTGGDSYNAAASVYSGDTSSTAPGTWTVFVNATGLEIPGTPTLVTIDASIVGEVFASGAGLANASWLLSTNLGSVMSGTASQLVPGLTPFSDSGSLSFLIPLNSSFQLTLLYQLDATGAGIASSRAEVLASSAGPLLAPGGLGVLAAAPLTTTTLTITAEVGGSLPTVPEPGTLSLFGLGAVGLVAGKVRRRSRRQA